MIQTRALVVCVLIVLGAGVLVRAQQPAATEKAPAAPPAEAQESTTAPPATDQPKTTAATQDAAADESAIRANAEKYVEAYNRRDSKTMASMWSPDAVYMDPNTGEGVIGRDAIAKQFDYAFAGSEDAKLEVDVESINFLSPNVAIEEGRATVTYSDFPPEITDYTAVHVKREGQWLIDRVSEVEVPPPPPSHYENLKELDWMTGSWIDDNDNTLIETDCEWTKNRNFLTRSFVMSIGNEVQLSGMQIIGWDPAKQQIRSWVFDSDGAFSEGTWTRKENRWFIKQVGTLADGAQSTATHIITQLDDDAFTWQSTDRTVDGEVLPNIEEALVRRAQPEGEEEVSAVMIIEP
jgi:uncharacterized protein (TIGR02246 family)